MARFRLAVVLRVRELAEDAARADLAATLARHLEAVSTATAARGRRLTLAAELAQVQQAGAVTAGELVEAAAAVERASGVVAAADEVVIGRTHDVVAARAALAEASRRRQVVERLRDRLAAAAALEAARREDAELGEIGLVQHARRTAAREAAR